MAGGVALNCVANGRLLREGPFENIWIQPAAGDAGGALGAALLAWHHEMNQPRQTAVARRTDGLAARSVVRQRRHRSVPRAQWARPTSRIDDEEELLDRVARLMADEKVIGWFQGRMEFGPRALGCRSIIGDARSPRMQQKMNVSIKFRESFRPFAPCVLREHVDEYFEMRPDEDSPYMLLVAPVRERWRTTLSDEDRRKMEDPDLEDPCVGAALDGAGDYARRLFGAGPDRGRRTARPLLPADEALPRAHRMSHHRQHQLQHSRRADRVHA